MHDSMADSSIESNITVRNGRPRRYPPGPLFSCLSTADEACSLVAVTLSIEAERKLSLADIAQVAAAMGSVFDRIAAAFAAGEYDAVVENPKFPEVTRFVGPDGEVFPHWGMAMDGGYMSSVGIRRSGIRRPGESGGAR